ncbi:MAG: MurR/RpiR family transcriptional regulator [Anaerolineaceae bacterium]|nr:MurR/RpiR family transcriptional regulator [Anaerolineaceae bacterium]
MTTKEKMDERLAQMTASERKIYRKILENSTLFSLKTIAQTAKELNLSSATLVRFAQSLGFSGYAAFKHSLQKEEILSSSPALRMKRLLDSHYTTSIKQIFQSEHNALNEFVENLDEVLFTCFVKDLQAAANCYAVGWRESSFLAELLAYRMRYTSVNCQPVLRNRAEFSENLIQIPSASILVVFDFYPYSKAILNAAEMMKKKGVAIALITDYRSSRVCDFADYVFYCPSRTEYLMNSLIVPIFFINSLVSELLEKDAEHFVDFLSEREKAFEESGEFYS